MMEDVGGIKRGRTSPSPRRSVVDDVIVSAMSSSLLLMVSSLLSLSRQQPSSRQPPKRSERRKRFHGGHVTNPSLGNLLITGELVEGALELVANCFVLVLLLDEVGFEFIAFLLEFAGLTLALGGASFSVLETRAEIADGLLVRLLTRESLSLGDFKRFHVVADNLQLLFELLDLGFGVIGALLGALEINLQHRQASRCLIVFSVRVLGYHLSLSQGEFQRRDSLLIQEASVLQNFASSLGLV